MTEARPRKPKKSETLEVRLPHDTKQAFLSACREDGTTASEVVRESIDGYLDARGRPDTATQARNVIAMIPKPIRNWKVAAGAAGAVGLSVFAIMPSAANPDFLSAFKVMDVNGDGVLTAEEFAAERAGGKDIAHDHEVMVVKTKVVTTTGDGGDTGGGVAGEPVIKEDSFTYWLPDAEGAADAGAPASAPGPQRREMRVEVITSDGDKPHAPIVMTMEDVRAREFKTFDTDGDGKVSYAEYEARQRAMLTRGFERLDADKNGSLSEGEYLKIGQPMAITMSWSSDGTDIPPVAIPEIKPAASDATLKAAFAKLDKNGDGKLSLQEYLPAT